MATNAVVTVGSGACSQMAALITVRSCLIRCCPKRAPLSCLRLCCSGAAGLRSSSSSSSSRRRQVDAFTDVIGFASASLAAVLFSFVESASTFDRLFQNRLYFATQFTNPRTTRCVVVNKLMRHMAVVSCGHWGKMLLYYTLNCRTLAAIYRVYYSGV